MNEIPLNSTTFCVDTNLLIEFIALDRLPWKTLAPAAELVRVIVPTKVGEEMDRHKSKSGRLRRRAIEFSQLARRMEDSADGIVVLREAEPRVTVEFGPLFRKSQLDADRFELEDPDNRIVAEVFAISQQIPNIILLADDSKPIRLARQAGIKYVRPLMEWRRQEVPDERDVEIEELKREIGAAPVLTLGFSEAESEKRIIIEDGPDGTDEGCANAFSQAVVETQPQVPRDELISRYGHYTRGPYDVHSGLYGAPGLTSSQLDTYEDDYRRFIDTSRKVAHSLHRIFFRFGFTHYLEIKIGNDGTRAAEKVLVEAEVSAPFKFLHTKLVFDKWDLMLEAPSPPKPHLGVVRSPGANIVGTSSEIPRVDFFHRLDGPDKKVSDAGDTYMSWRCEELRQGTYFFLPVLIATDQTNAKGALEITASSAVLAKRILKKVPMEVRSIEGAAGPKYFLQRLDHLPETYRNAFRGRLEALAGIPGKR